MHLLGQLASHVVLGAALLLPGAAWAGVDMGLKNCQVRFASDFAVKPSGVHSTQGDAVYLFKPDGEVRVNGASLSLSGQQRQLVASYTGGLQQFMPDLVAFVADTLRTVGAAMGHAMAGVFGADSEPAKKIEASLAQSQARLTASLAEHPGEYHVVNDQLDVLDSAFDEDFERSVEEAVESSMGSVMAMLGSALFGEGSFEERMASFGEKMENFGEQVEREMEAKTPAIEQRGDALCKQAEAIEEMEYRLRETIPELAHYRLMDSRKKAREAAQGGEQRAQ
ncbi:YggN family protein [Simiduia sp. 21SJ11W-1]|uniref:DUF2884 family protein n=1 Tax=Simiduia sp. 21SJ11W-1 TaxID=2909669 RepID=UPI00209F83EA|nr:DUF2884 family protein [Simiduia sp. 21SJ11W-1]UTA47555.1 YggN family protein [Simiduia sp. 21SJ11W-1]